MIRIFGFLFCILLPATVSAQDRNFTFTVGSGIVIPRGPETFEDLWQDGVNINGGIYYSLNKSIQIGIQTSQYYFEFDSQKLNDQFQEQNPDLSLALSGNDTKIEVFMPSFRIIAPSLERFLPYVQAGAGFFRIKIDESEQTINFPDNTAISFAFRGDKETAFALNIGGGVAVSLNERSSLLLEINLIVGFTEEDTTTILPLDFKYQLRL
jgi:hypothetical protein